MIFAECDRLGDSRADYSAKHRRHGVNVWVVTDPDGRLLWIFPARPGRAHDLTAARTHRIIRICERLWSVAGPDALVSAGIQAKQDETNHAKHPHDGSSRSNAKEGP